MGVKFKKGPKPTLTSKRRSLFIDALHTMYTFGCRAYRYRSARVMHIWCFLHYPNLQKIIPCQTMIKKLVLLSSLSFLNAEKSIKKQPRKYKRFLLFIKKKKKKKNFFPLLKKKKKKKKKKS